MLVVGGGGGGGWRLLFPAYSSNNLCTIKVIIYSSTTRISNTAKIVRLRREDASL